MKRLLTIVIIALVIVTCDQITKIVAKRSLQGAGTVEVVGEYVVLIYAENHGAFLSFGSTWPRAVRSLVFGILSGVVVLLAIVFVLREKELKPIQVVSLSFLIGGGIGNLIDRAIHSGAVVDFMNVGIGRVRTGIFNVADLFLMAGGAFFLVSSLRYSRTSPK